MMIAQQESTTIPPSGGPPGSGIGVGGQPVAAGGGGMTGVIIPGVSDIERTVKSLNGYHEDILEALRRSAAQGPPRSSANTPSGSISEELLRKTIADCVTAGIPLGPPPSVYPTEREYKRSCSSRTGSKENICEPSQHVLSDTGATSTLLQHHRQQQQMHPQDEDDTPTAGPLRIRNLEDLIRQLEHHSSRHMSPSGSEDIRMSETEVDRHYRVDSSAACSESSHGSNQQLAQSQKTATILPPYSSRCRPPRSDDESRFSYGAGGGGGGGGTGGPEAAEPAATGIRPAVTRPTSHTHRTRRTPSVITRTMGTPTVIPDTVATRHTTLPTRTCTRTMRASTRVRTRCTRASTLEWSTGTTGTR
ncbi:hypothetical protein quinque_000180 [Culex quinquefasciatus]